MRLLRRAPVVALLALAACHRAPPPPPALPPVLDELSVKLARVLPADLPRPSDEKLTALARAAVAAAPGVLSLGRGGEPARPRMHMKVELELGYVPDKSGTLRALVHVTLEPKSGPTGGAVRIDREALIDKEELGRVPDAATVEAHLAHAFGLTVGGVVRAEQLWLGPPAAAREVIGGKDPELRDEGVRIAGERRDRAAVPSLLALLKTDEPELRDALIGVLAEIGDERAVRPLADLAKFGDMGELPKILDALSRIGGDQATSYLEFVADGHPSPEMKALAKRALEHLRARGTKQVP